MGYTKIESSLYFLNVHCVIFQHEAKTQTLLENVKEVEAKKRILEEAVDTLNESLAKKSANGMHIFKLLFRHIFHFL